MSNKDEAILMSMNVSRNKANLRLLLENKFNDIRYTKQQQWHLIYLTLIAIVGITSLAFYITGQPCLTDKLYLFRFLIIFEIFIGIIAGSFIISYAFKLKEYRSKKDDYLRKLPHYSTNEKKNYDNIVFTVCFCIVIILSLVASIWSINKLEPNLFSNNFDIFTVSFSTRVTMLTLVVHIIFPVV